MRFIDRAQAVALAAFAVVVLVASAGSARAAQPGVFEVRIAGLGLGHNQVTLAFPRPIGMKTLLVTDAASQAILAHAVRDDVAKVEVDDVTAPTSITKVDQVTRWVGKGPRALTFVVVAIILVGVAFAVTKLRPLKLVIGNDNRVSNSQTQLALWFGAVALVYVSALWVRLEWLGWDFIGGIGLTDNLMILTGLSAISFGGAKAIAVHKDATPAAAAAPGPAPRASVYDLFTNDSGVPDLGDVQMILVTATAVAIFVATSFHFLGKLTLASPVTLPDVDTALLAGFGIGQGAYLFKKAALPPGQG